MTFRIPSSGPEGAFKDTEYMLVVTANFEPVYQAGYPGADIGYRIEPQEVRLKSNGYYCTARLKGTVIWRGSYGGPLNVEGEYLYMRYAYEVDKWMEDGGNPNPIIFIKK